MMSKIRTLSKEFQQKAKEELNEDPSRIQEDLQHLKDWLQKQPHLTARQDDDFLLCFLRCCKFSLQRTKEKLDYFHSIKTLWPEYFCDRNTMSEEIQRVFDIGAVCPLPQPNGAIGPRIILVRWEDCTLATIRFQTIVKVTCMMIDILLQEDDNIVIGGMHLIIDFKNIAPGYILQMTPKAVHRSANLVQSGYPLRIKGFDFINVPTIFDNIFALVKSVLSEKLKDRAHSYTENTLSDLFKNVPQALFPNEYGGRSGSVNEIAGHWKKKVESYSKWYEEDAQYCSNETLRPDESKGEMFGIDGTFRRLNID